MKKRIVKISALILAFLLILPTFLSCESQPITSGKNALAVVGTVGNFEVPYEEFYFFANSYKEMFEDKYGDNAKEHSDELRGAVYKDIVSNYAVLTLAAEAGLSIDSDEVQEEVQSRLDSYIKEDFGGKRRDYKKYLKEQEITDNYIRFSIAVDIVYSQLVSEYIKTGVINNDEQHIQNAIKENFVRTWHIMIPNADGNTSNYDIAKEALGKINSGTSMFEMIGSKYNKDFMLTTTDGYYFTKGAMDESYEKAAYNLEVGEISGIVEATAQVNGEQINCYYIIQRLELEDSYIKTNFETLRNKYLTSVVYEKVENLESALIFAPNEYCNSLDLFALEKPDQIDTFITGIIIAITVSCIACAAIVTVIVVKFKKKRAAK